MTKHVHDRPQVRTLSEQERRRAVPEVVEPLLTYLRVPERLLEVVRDVRAIERRTDGRGEDEAVLLPP